jgi:hypothetical protein
LRARRNACKIKFSDVFFKGGSSRGGPREGVGTIPREGVGTIPREGVGTIPREGMGTIPSEGVGTIPSEGVGTIPSEGVGTIPCESRPGQYSLSESRKIIFLAWVTRTCRQFGLVRTYVSREGDMSWGRGPG